MPNFSLLPLIQGFGLGASLIIAIGAQNAFVLRQGLKRQHVFTEFLSGSPVPSGRGGMKGGRSAPLDARIGRLVLFLHFASLLLYCV